MVAPRSPAFAFRLLSATAVASIAIPAGLARAQDPRSRVSVDSNGVEGNGDSGPATLSGDGRFVAFTSSASNLVAGDTNYVADVFVHDLLTGATVRVSVDSNGAEGDQASGDPVLSFDGRFVAFTSSASSLVAGDKNYVADVFVHDRDPDGNGIFDEGNGVTTRVSVRTNGDEGNAGSRRPAISADGLLVAFESDADNLAAAGDHNSSTDVFVHDRAAGTTRRMSVDSNGVEGDRASSEASISADGRFVAFSSGSTNLVANDGNQCGDVFVRDRTAGTTVRVSVDSAGVEGDKISFEPSISGDGSRVAFASRATNFSANDDDRFVDVFVHDLSSGATILASADAGGAGGNGASLLPSISADGQVVAFVSNATNLSAPDLDGFSDVFVADLLAGTIAPVTWTAWRATVGGGCGTGALSADGSRVAFSSVASSLVVGDTNGSVDAFVYDRSIPEPVAESTNYGAGFPGTLGVPDLTASGPPVFGDAVAITVDNSSGIWAPALLAFGFERASIPTRAGGTLLVDAPHFYIEAIPPLGLTMPYTVPFDPALCGVRFELQVLELDAGAQFGIAFTPGLEWVIGN